MMAIHGDVFPHELRVGDVVEIGGSEWRVMSKPRVRPRGKSLEIALEHVKHRGEFMVWSFDQYRRVRRVEVC